tara:strand:- start:1466 stop:2590 length:1125 start_codon:yes stop_codon:yes gene_type:complete
MKKILSILTLSTAVSFAAQAEVRINGFANLIGGLTSSDDTLYGYDDNISFSEESVFAIQLSGDINDKMTATGQLVARGVNDYDAKFEWAYISYQASDNIKVSAGRLRQPFFRYSASQDVGYSYHWIAPPPAVYDIGVSNIDGVKVEYSTYAGDWEYNLQFSYGHLEADNAQGLLKGDNAFLFAAEATYEWFKIRAMVEPITITLINSDIDALLGNLTALGLDGLRSDLDLVEKSGIFAGIGVEIDTYDWFVLAEFTEASVDESFFQPWQSYYVSAGFRTGKWTPSITFESFDSVNELKYLDQVAVLPAELQPAVGGITAGLQIAGQRKFDVASLAVRYDLDTNIALKADISKYADDLNELADATLLRVAVNYVF